MVVPYVAWRCQDPMCESNSFCFFLFGDGFGTWGEGVGVPKGVTPPPPNKFSICGGGFGIESRRTGRATP